MKFNFETDLRSLEHCVVYRDWLAAEIQSNDTARRKEARKNIERLYNAYTRALDRRGAKKKWRAQHEALFSPAYLQNQIDAYYQQKDVAIQQSIVSGLYFPMLVLMPDHLPLVVDFLCDVVQHKSGNVRKAAVSVSTWIGFGVNRGKRSLDPDYHPDTHNANDELLDVRIRAHLQLVENIQTLISKYDVGYPKPFVFNDLKPSVYKSLYMLLEITTRCWRDYADQAYVKESGIDPDDPHLDPDKILHVENGHADRQAQWQAEVEMHLEDILGQLQGPVDQQFVWSEQAGVIAGQTFLDGTFVGTGAGGVGESFRNYCYIPWRDSEPDLTDQQKAGLQALTGTNEYFPGLRGVHYESVAFTDQYVCVTILIPYDVIPEVATDNLLIRIDQLRVPVSLTSFVTNVSKPTHKQVCDVLAEMQKTSEEFDTSLLSDKYCFDFVLCETPPINPDQATQHAEFTDRVRVQDCYFELMEELPASPRGAATLLRHLLVLDPDFLDTYTMLAEVYEERRAKNTCSPESFVSEAYHRACVLISDRHGNWPKDMSWGWQENRHIMRALANYAYLVWEKGHSDIALDIFRRLLEMNPNDNQGARYEILAILLNFKSHWHAKFAAKDAPAEGLLDAVAMNNWFEREAKKFPKDFAAFWDNVARQNDDAER